MLILLQLVTALGLVTAAISACAAPVVTCPATASHLANSGFVQQKLAGVSLWEYPVRESLDSESPSSMVPDQTTGTWQLTTTPGWRDALVCEYGPFMPNFTRHFLLFDVTGLTTCTADTSKAGTPTATCR